MKKTKSTPPRKKRTLSDIPIEQRVLLVEEIWDSIYRESNNLPLAEHEIRIIDECLEEHLRDPEGAIPYEEIEKEFRY